MKICQCGKEIHVRACREKIGKDKYCSKACMYDSGEFWGMATAKYGAKALQGYAS